MQKVNFGSKGGQVWYVNIRGQQHKKHLSLSLSLSLLISLSVPILPYIHTLYLTTAVHTYLQTPPHPTLLHGPCPHYFLAHATEITPNGSHLAI